MESNLDLKIKTPKLNVESVSSAVFGRKDQDTSLKSSINNIHGTLSKLTAHVRKSLIRIKGLESGFGNIEEKLIINTEKTTEVEKKIVFNTEKTTEIEKKIVNIEKVVDIPNKPKLESGGLRDSYNNNDSLIETNKILVDIQNQLILQSKQEKTQEKEEKRQDSIKESKKKLKKEESDLAKNAKKITKNVGKLAVKIIKPLGGIFDKILEFITLLGAGVALNAAFAWFQNEENRKKITKFFNILGKNWQLFAKILGTLALAKIATSLVSTLLTLKAVFALIANPFFLAGIGVAIAAADKSLGGDLTKVLEEVKDAGDGKITRENINAAIQKREQYLKDPKFEGFAGFTNAVEKQRVQREVVFLKTGFYGGLGQENAVGAPDPLNWDLLIEASKAGDVGIDFFGNMKVEPRAMGGSVLSGQSYLVGEMGPEIFSPNIDGSIINNMRTEKIYQMISSDTGEGNISMIELPPIANEMKPPEVKVPSGEVTEVPNFPSANAADQYRILSPQIYGITV